MTDLISVIIPTYKRPTYLNRAIESVLQQKNVKVEIIIVDDNNQNDLYRKETEQLMQNYLHFENVMYLKHEKNKNGSAARNTGLRHSTGEYICFLDDDDEFLSEKLFEQKKILEISPENIGAVYCGFNIFRGGHKNKTTIPTSKGNFTSELLQMQWGTGSGSNPMFKREVFKKIGLFDEELKRHQDWDILIRFFQNYDIEVVDSILFNIHKDSRINIPNAVIFKAVKNYYLGKHKEIIDNLPEKSRGNVYAMHNLEIAIAYLKNKDFKNALTYYGEAKRNSQISLMKKLSMFLISIFFLIPRRDHLLSRYGVLIEKFRIIKS